jgi:hypothetical protein
LHDEQQGFIDQSPLCRKRAKMLEKSLPSKLAVLKMPLIEGQVS